MRFQNTVLLAGTLLQLPNVVLTSNGTTLKSSLAARSDYVPLLTCIDELRGVLNGVDYDQPSRIVDCGHEVKFCQKITGHFISATSTTQITMRGCDPIQVEGQFTGIPCQKEGCYEEMIDVETFNICCCSSDMCNSASHQRYYVFLIATLFTMLSIR
ncbi:hypothetical protein V3C99_014137 [Haemonchus contortus]|uniref:Protein quiver n=1 Tax=Haemonchus contortus TaxID=6289 RepID=A0A7I4YUC0_HAECO|nr:Protein K12B6.9 [Haemonchus contortus]